MEGGIEFNTLATRNGTHAYNETLGGSGGATYAKHIYASYIYAEYCGTDSFSVGTLVVPYASEDVHMDHFYSYKHGYTGGTGGYTHGNGLTFSNVDGITASNIYLNISFNEGNGMVSWGSRNAVVNNIFIRQMSAHGLEISEASTSYPSNNWLVSNFDLEYNNGANLYIGYQTSNCSFINGLCTFSLANDGINVSSKCYRNFFTNVQTAWNNQYGLETHTAGSPYITNCEFLSNGAGAILNSPTFLTSCAGFVTENADNQTLCVNGTTIDHGLAGTPISVTLTIRGTTYINATCWYFYPTVYSVDATHITISFYWNHAGTVEAVSAALSQTIYWQAVYSP
jgi:hypothetical protein